jgi:hypothetical protein
VALWLASLHASAEIWLLGRSGRGQMGQLLGSCSAQIVVPRCDTACIQEVAAVLQHMAFTHVIHAGDTSNQAFPFFLLRGHAFLCPRRSSYAAAILAERRGSLRSSGAALSNCGAEWMLSSPHLFMCLHNDAVLKALNSAVKCKTLLILLCVYFRGPPARLK